MKSNLLSHKGYYGSVELSVEDKIFFGKIEFIRDLVNYEGESAKEIEASFKEAVDDYLETCKQERRKPDSTLKGSFNVRVGQELHEKIALNLKRDQSLNSFIVDAVKEKLKTVG